MEYKLTIDEGFNQLIPPLSANEQKQLEENIVHDGCREPICVWNNIILDGHNRQEKLKWHTIMLLVCRNFHLRTQKIYVHVYQIILSVLSAIKPHDKLFPKSEISITYACPLHNLAQ